MAFKGQIMQNQSKNYSSIEISYDYLRCLNFLRDLFQLTLSLHHTKTQVVNMLAQIIGKIFRYLFSIGDRKKICHFSGFQSDFQLKNRPPRKRSPCLALAQFFKTSGKSLSLKHLRYCVLMYIITDWNIQEIICALLEPSLCIQLCLLLTHP